MSRRPATYAERCAMALVQFTVVIGILTLVLTWAAILAPERLPQ